MDQLRPRWEVLADGPQATLFQSYSWNRLAAAHFGDREAPYVVLSENDNGVALIPGSILSNGEISLLGEALFDYRDTLSKGDPAVLLQAWRMLADFERPVSVMSLRGDPVRRRWAAFKPHEFCNAPGVALGRNSAESIEANHRKLGRFSRRLERLGVVLRHHDGSDARLLRWIYEQKAKQFHGAGNNLFADSRRIDFLIAATLLAPSACDVFTYETTTEVIAALVTFRDRDTRRFYTIYFDQRWAKESPGQVLVYKVTLQSLAEGLNCDYMTGEQSHKMRLATLLVPLYRVQLSARELRKSLAEAQPAQGLVA